MKTKSQQGRASKDKGKVGEREVAALLKEYGFVARRGQQFSGRGDAPDVVHNMQGLHIEVKRTERLSLYEALEQAREDMNEGSVPVIFHRRSRKEWVVVLPASDFLTMMQEIYDER